MFTDVLDEIHVPGRGPACTRPERVLADKGYPSKKNRARLRERGIKVTIPERADQIAKRRKRPGRPVDFGDEQQERYQGRNVVERCFNFVKQWRGLATRHDKTASSYAAGVRLSAALQWI
ncbi:transposase [Paramicrobacterium sp. CJ85]|uniref:transposase n=1 Tax=Paramicrobacterium sp. CJ85 TaxID=3445355 RepID=UPI003F62787D